MGGRMKIQILTALTISLLTVGANASQVNIIRTTAPVAYSPPSVEIPPPVEEPEEPETPSEPMIIGLSTATLSQGRVGVPYSYNFVPRLEWGAIPVSERDTPVFSASEAIHEGLTIGSNGVLDGTPLEGGNFQFTLKAQNQKHAGQQTYALSVLDFSFNADELTPVILGKAYSYKFTDDIAWTGLLPEQTTGGLQWDVASGSDPLPQGMTLSNAGILTGNPGIEGTHTFTVEANSQGLIKQKEFSLVVDGSALELQSVGGGSSHSCGLTPGKTVKCWGANGSGQLGDATTAAKYYPVDVINFNNVRALSVGSYHNCAVTEDNRAYCWGNGANGRLGHGTNMQKTIPTEIANISGQVQSIVAGNQSTCAILLNGDLYCWGSNTYGVIGAGLSNDLKVPTKITLPVGAKMIALGGQNAYVIGTDGGVYATGSNANGAMTSEHISIKTFVKLNQITGRADSIYSGLSSTSACAIMEGGTPLCWGSAAGNGYSVSDTPITPTGISSVKSISIEQGQKCALLSTGGISCWGDAEYGLLGTNDYTDSSVPIQPIVELRSRVKQISSGLYHRCIVLDSGATKCWGSGTSGQLGNNSTSGTILPSSVVPNMP